MKKLLLFICVIGFHTLTAQSDFYKTDKVQDIHITFEEDNWSMLLDSLRTNGDGLLLADAKINGKDYKNVGVRWRGSKSFQTGSKRNALYIKLNYIDKNQNIDGHKSVKLSNSQRDPSMVREVLSYEIARNYMPAPQANYAQVKVNDKPYGLYVNLQSVDDAFLEQYFGTADGAFFKVNSEADNDEPDGCKQNIFGSLEYDSSIRCYLNNFEMLSENGWSDLMELARTLNEDTGNIENILDVDNTLWMLALNNALVNLDSYTGKNSTNFYLYQDENGKFNPVLWDMNLSFGSLKNIGTGSDLDLKELQELDPLLHADNTTKPLISKLLADETYKKMYLGHLRTIVQSWLKDDKYANRADELRRLIQVPYSNDQNSQYTFSEFQQAMDNTTGERSKIPGIKELMDARYDYLKKHPALAVIPAQISEVKVLGRKQFAKGNISNYKINAQVDKYPTRVWAWYRSNEDEPFKSVVMYDDGAHNDGAAGDGIFGATVSGGESIDYYIQAENASIMSYSPESYMFEQYEANLKELNK